jgi:hypothetical protein
MSKFTVVQWEKDVIAAVAVAESSGIALTKLVRQAAENQVDEEKAREVFQTAYAAAYAKSMNVTEEEARKSKSYRNRVSDAMAVFKADPKHVEGLVGSVQTVAAKVRKAAAQPGTPRQPKGAPGESGQEAAKVDASQVKPFALLNLAIEALVKECGDDATALEALGALKDAGAALMEILAPNPASVKQAA